MKALAASTSPTSRCLKELVAQASLLITGISMLSVPLFDISLALAPQALPVVEEPLPLQAHHLALLDTFSALLTQEQRPAASVSQTDTDFPTHSAFSVLNRLAVQGIRVGPQRLS